MAKDSKVEIAPVSKAGEESQVRSLEDTLLVEARVQEDQIPDYHQTHKTLDATGEEHDPEVQARLRLEAVKKAGPSKKEAKERAEEIKAVEGDPA